MIDYLEYINSPKWQRVRAIRLRKDKFTCQQCGGKNELNVHHLTYKRLGRERIEDLITLCVRCHNDTHYFSDKIPLDEKSVLRAMPITEEDCLRRKEELFGDRCIL